MFRSNPFQLFNRIISLVLIAAVALSPSTGYAQGVFVATLPEPGAMLGTSAAFTPVLVKGMVVTRINH